MTRQDLVNKSIDKLNTVKEALELINILEYDECIAVLTGTKNLPSEIHSALMRRGKEANGGKTTLALPVERIADKNCILFMWATFPKLQEALATIKAWGFEYKTIGFCWVKRNKNGSWFKGIGFYTKSNSEVCLIATKGKPPKKSVHHTVSYNDDAYVREDGSHADKLYFPMFGGSYDGTRIRSLAGQALMYNTNASTEIARAKANGAGWNIGSWSKRNLLNCMLKIMSKTDNSQTAFGQGQTSGYVNDASQNYGHLATGTLKDKGQFFGYNDTTHEVKVFYMEKTWGNRWDRINGLLMVGGEILAKMTPPYNLTGKDFEKVGITFTSSGNGYQKGTKSSRFGRIVNSIGGSSSTYTCDYFWWNAGITAVALVGGSCNDGEACGADCLYLNGSAGNAYWSIGASVFLEQPIAA